MNKVILMGRLTREPDVRYSSGENSSAHASYTLAVDRRYSRRDGSDNGQQTADFIRCVVFGRGAEFAEKYLHQGTKVLVTGRIQTGSYTNRDGVKVYTTDVIVEDQEFAESKAAASERASSGVPSGSGSYGSAPAPAAAAPAGDSPDNGFMNIPEGIDEELPFA